MAQAVEGTLSAAREIGTPQPGFFRLRLVRGGPWVSARIYLPCPVDPEFGYPMDRSRHLTAEIDGAVDARPDAVTKIWITGRPITAADFAFMNADADWCRRHAPLEPKAAPRESIDPRRAPPAF